MTGHQANRRLARTMNLGLALDAAVEGEWGLTLTREHLLACQQAGFTAVRLPVRWAARTDPDAPFTLRAPAARRVATIVSWATDLDLTVVLGNHPDEALMADPAGHRARFLLLWQQLSDLFADIPDGALYFEPLCEPHGALEPGWNELFADVLAVIRSRSRTRPVVVGPTGHNRADRLTSLVLPVADRNLVVTFHYYLPITFTMQGERWLADALPDVDVDGWLGTTWDTEDAEWPKAQAVFAAVATWARAHDRPVFLGELGVSDHAPEAARTAWIAAHRVAAEQHGFSWGCWSFGSLFSVYDLSVGAWRDTVLTALIPSG